MPDSADIVGTEPPSLVSLSYLSTPMVTFSDRHLSDLLLAARQWNARHRVTSKLIVLEDGDRIVRFAQWIEGAALEIEASAGRILSAPRYGDFEIRHRGPIEARRFPGWDVAIHQTDALTFDDQASVLTVHA